MQTFTHQKWCTRHIIEEDGLGGADDVCRTRVTIDRFTVDVEDSPAWCDGERDQIVPPDISSCSAEEARLLAAALLETARLVEEAQ